MDSKRESSLGGSEQKTRNELNCLANMADILIVSSAIIAVATLILFS